MAGYYFTAEDGQCFPDDEGTDLPNLEAAKREAVGFMVDSLRGRPEMLWDGLTWRVTVTDERHMVLFIIDVSALLSPATGSGRKKAT
jgi:hypothetical protein